jgi:hypothetical protein
VLRKSAPEQRKAHGRSRITNGSALLPGVDQRSAWVRRCKDLLAAHIADLGGDSNISEAERALIRRAVTLIVECERREVGFAQAGEVSDAALAIYQTTVNTLRRTLEALGLKRRAKDVTTLGDLLREDWERQQREQQAAPSEATEQ